MRQAEKNCVRSYYDLATELITKYVAWRLLEVRKEKNKIAGWLMYNLGHSLPLLYIIITGEILYYLILRNPKQK